MTEIIANISGGSSISFSTHEETDSGSYTGTYICFGECKLKNDILTIKTNVQRENGFIDTINQKSWFLQNMLLKMKLAINNRIQNRSDTKGNIGSGVIWVNIGVNMTRKCSMISPMTRWDIKRTRMPRNLDIMRLFGEIKLDHYKTTYTAVQLPPAPLKSPVVAMTTGFLLMML